MSNETAPPPSSSPTDAATIEAQTAPPPALGSLIGGPLPDTPAPALTPEPPAAAEPVAEHAPLALGDLKLPEGMRLMDGDKPLPEAEEFLSLLNGAKVPKESAEALLGLHEKFLQSAADQYLARWETTQNEWKKGVESMPEFGGAALPATLQSIAKVVDRYGDAEVREAFAVTGAGNHPAVVRFIAKIARDLNEAPPVRGTSSPSAADRAARMYPTSTQ